MAQLMPSAMSTGPVRALQCSRGGCAGVVGVVGVDGFVGFAKRTSQRAF